MSVFIKALGWGYLIGCIVVAGLVVNAYGIPTVPAVILVVCGWVISESRPLREKDRRTA